MCFVFYTISELFLWQICTKFVFINKVNIDRAKIFKLIKLSAFLNNEITNINYFPYLAHLALDLRLLCDPFLLLFFCLYILICVFAFYIVFIDLVFCVIFDAFFLGGNYDFPFLRMCSLVCVSVNVAYE